MSVQLIEIGSPAWDKLYSSVIQTTKEACKAEFEKEDDILTQEQAMKLLKVKSKQKMKAIRENGSIKWKMLGGVFLYSKKSIIEWINK